MLGERLICVLVVACGGTSTAPQPVSKPPIPIVREDPRRVLVERTFAAIAAGDEAALLALADADNVMAHVFACARPKATADRAFAVTLHLAAAAQRLRGTSFEIARIMPPDEHVTRTVIRRGERSGDCETQLAVEYQEFDVWVRRSGTTDDQWMRIKAAVVEGRFYLSGAPQFVRAERPEDIARVDQLAALADRMCACADRPCAELVQGDLVAWAIAKTKALDAMIVHASPDSAHRQSELSTRYSECLRRFP